MRNRKRTSIIKLIFFLILMTTIIGLANINSFDLNPGPTPETYYTITCKGYVKDLTTGRGISGAKAALKETSSGYSLSTYSSSSGYFQITIVVSSYQSFQLRISKTNYMSKSYYYNSPGTYYLGYVKLYKGSIICKGYVKDTSGNAISGATILLKETSSSISKSDVSDSNGYYYVKLTVGTYSGFTLEAKKMTFITQKVSYSSLGTKNKNFNLAPCIVEIKNLGGQYGNLDYLMRDKEITVIATCAGYFQNAYFKVGSYSPVLMTPFGEDNFYHATLATNNYVLGTHTMKVYITDQNGDIITYDTALITITNTIQMTLYYEIDYIEGHIPQANVLTYWHDYWEDRAIDLTFFIDDKISEEALRNDYSVDFLEDGLIELGEFWYLERDYNDYQFESYETKDDRTKIANGMVHDSQEKWILWGPKTINNAGGFAFVTKEENPDKPDSCFVTCGNYVFIADKTLSDFEANNGITNYGSHVVALMHETGHTIGIMKTVYNGLSHEEYYDLDSYSVMANISEYNSKLADFWYYSADYWRTRNDLY